MKNISVFSFLVLFVISAAAQKKNFTVTVHELGDPDGLNPLTSSSAVAEYIQNIIFCRLLEYNPKSLELEAQTALSRPQIQKITEGEYAGGMSLTYEIRPEAKWDNKEPITAADYIFTIKALKNPKTNCGMLRRYYGFIDSIGVDEQNPKKFTIYAKEPYFLAESVSGALYILPEYHYDPKKIMRNFSMAELNNPEEERLHRDENIRAFADEFNSVNFGREPGFVVGGGAYDFTSWTTGQEIVLMRKSKWWGDKVKGVAALEANPDKIIYKIIPDFSTAITKMKDGGIDVMHWINPNAFIELEDDQSFSEKYNLSTPDQFAYYYLGFNMKDVFFTDRRVRRAFAHLVDRETIIDVSCEGLASKINGPVSPHKPYCNKNLQDIDFDPEKAKELLTEAGWTDTDGDGILDKVIDGQKKSMKIEYKYNQGNTTRKNIGLMLKDECERVGIEVDIIAREWVSFLDDMEKRDFEIVGLAWVKGPDLDDMRQIWHTDSDNYGGSNRVGFGSPESDKIIDEIEVTLDEEKRKELYIQLQEIIYFEQPYVFLFAPSERISISKRFEAEPTVLRPGYKVQRFRLAK